MSNLPLVSVLIRTRDRLALLQKALQSVLLQDYLALDIIVVNDRGENFQASLPAVSAPRSLQWFEVQGAGRSAAANTALKLARGDYCLFLDDDDWLDSGHISKLVSTLGTAHNSLVAYTDTRTHTPDGIINEQLFASAFDEIRLLTENYITIHAALFSHKLVELGCSFNEQLDCYEDWDFWLQAACHGAFVHVPGCSANYRVAAGSGFGATQDNGENRAALYRKWLPRWSNTQLLAVLDRARTARITESLRQEYQEQSKFVQHLQDTEKQLVDELKQRAEKITELVATFDVLTQSNLELKLANYELKSANHDLNSTASQLTNELKMANYHLEVETSVVNALRADLNLIYNSRSWRLTKPLRKCTNLYFFLRTEGLWSVMRRIHHKFLRKKPLMPHSNSALPNQKEYQTLVFPAVSAPLVSIVIPVFNKFEYTYNCLQAVLANTAEVACEIIVVDDCSTDETPVQLAAIENITTIRNAVNSGFIHSCNTGAQAASGKYLLLLNNDTAPQPGWLTAMLTTFTDFPEAGMVGAKLLFADGSLQEAGGIVWRDASAWNYGRGQDENRPEFSYARAVDYCSGACLLLSKADYLALGMFDTLYTPAYYEDTDLAFKVRASGKQVIYQPQARVIHFEGVSNGTDLSGGIKEYQRVNHSKFRAQWDQVLATHAPNGEHPELERERQVSRRVLIVDAQVLMPDRDSGSLRMFNFIKVFQRLGYKVTFVPDNMQYHERYTPMLQTIGVECQYGPYLGSVSAHLQEAGHLYDVVVLSRADYAEKNIDAVLKYCPQAQVLFDTVDLHFLREARAAELSGDAMLKEAADMRKLQELGIARKSNLTLVVSPVEVELFRQEAPDVKVALISNIHDVKGRKAEYAQRENILFIGSFDHPPNIDAMHWFIDEIFPLLQARKPELKVLIVGASAPGSLLAKANSHIEFTGFVADIEPLFTGIRLSIAPLRYGAGVKGKINSSMTYGVPVVATTVAAEGMGLVEGTDVLIADTPEQFAAAVERAYDDPQLWQALSDAGLANINRCFSFEVATEQLRAVLADKDSSTR